MAKFAKDSSEFLKPTSSGKRTSAKPFWRMKGENTEARLYSLDLTLKWLELAGKRGEYAIISY